MLKVINSLLVIVFLISIGVPVGAESRPYKGLVISEVKVRYDTAALDDPDEFIELHNDSTEPILLSNYQLQYFNLVSPEPSAVPITHAMSENLLLPNARVVFAQQPIKIPDSLPLTFSSLSDTGGKLRLIDQDNTVVDEIAWTSTQSVSNLAIMPPVLWQCTSSSLSCTSNKVLSHSRSFDGLFGYGLNEITWSLGTSTPESSVLVNPVEEEPEELPEEVEVTMPEQTCEGVIISEVLPNPLGVDEGKEFIELHNPTNSTISMAGCSLQTSANTKLYYFENVELLPGAYVAFYNSTTNLTLNNAAGGTVWLLSGETELHTVIYPAAMTDDMSWGIFETGWDTTYAMTPDQINVLLALKPCAEGLIRNEYTGRCQQIISTVNVVLAPCEPGQERNPATNRCRAITVASLAACGPGQERNPDTNRCRSVSTALRALAPCKPGQERNPETNRCRTTEQDQALAACPAGQSRNPDTNRCRQSAVSGGSTLAAVSDVQTPSDVFGPGWWTAGGVVLIALGYGLYEWRHEALQLANRVRTKLKP